MSNISKLSIGYQRRFLIYAHVINSAIVLLAESTNLTEEYWGTSLAELAIEIVDAMSDTEVKETVQDAESQLEKHKSVHKIRMKRHEN